MYYVVELGGRAFYERFLVKNGDPSDFEHAYKSFAKADTFESVRQAHKAVRLSGLNQTRVIETDGTNNHWVPVYDD